MLKKWLRQQIEKRNGEIDQVIATVTAENRDMTPEEDAKVKELNRQAAGYKKQLDELPDTDLGDEPPPATVRSAPPGPAPAAGTAHADARPYSFLRCVRLAAEGKPLDGLEAEVDQEIRRKDPGRTYKGFAMPAGSDPEIRAMMYPGDSARRVAAVETRDMTTTTGAATIFVEPKSFVDLLRAKLVINRTGAQIMTGMQGLFAIPRQTGTGTVYWLGEGNSATPSNPTFDQVNFTPKLAIATTPITKQFVMQTSIDAEARVKADLTAILAQAADQVVLTGTGGTQPLGLFNNTVIQALSVPLAGPSANGDPYGYTRAIAQETLVSTFNADQGKLAFVSNTAFRGSTKAIPLATAQTGATSYPMFLWANRANGDGEINGYPVYVTNNVPANFVKGSSSNLSGVIFGDWSMLTVAFWDTGVDVIVDPFTGKRAGTIEVTMEMAMDSKPTREQSFNIVTDVKTS